MLLKGKTAVVYGGAGSIGDAVSRAFPREGASVFLAGRTLRRLIGAVGVPRSGRASPTATGNKGESTLRAAAR